MQFYWSAFHDLTTERQIGMGVGPIPYSAMRAYAIEYNIRGRDEFDYFSLLLQAMDNAYMAHTNNAGKSQNVEMVPVSDVEEQHRMFARMKARAAEANKKQRTK